jgi:uncharacterized protein (DUF952 family)
MTTQKDWENAQFKGEYTAPSLLTDGFIHCSTIKQTAGTANLFFRGQNGLILMCIDEKKLKSECKYEDPAGGTGEHNDPRIDNLFPHIYGPINNSAVIKVINFPPDENGFFKLPKELTK